jgi:NADPH-dependent 2,4-dienoyl-CoA reductase/sulfur reductase-like enzyme
MPMKRDISNVTPAAGGSTATGDSTIENGNYTNGDHSEIKPLDMLIVGAGFAGVYLLHQLRKRGFTAKIVEVLL